MKSFFQQAAWVVGVAAIAACSSDTANNNSSNTSNNGGTQGTATGGSAGNQTGPSGGTGGTQVSNGGAAVGGAAGSGGAAPVGGSAGVNAGGTAGVSAGGTGGAGGQGGASGGTAGAGGSNPNNPGNYPPPPREIMVTNTAEVSTDYNGSTGTFDPTKTIQKKLFVPMGGVNSGPMNFGWAVERGYHMIAVPVANGYPDDEFHREYLEAWSGENLGAGINQPPENSVMGRVKSMLAYLVENDPGADWGYYLDTAGEVRWNDVIVFGYSFGGQMGVAATKYVALDRVVITASPNVPIDAPWLTEMPNITPVERCYQFVGYNEGEHETHINETALLGWLGEPFDVGDGVQDPPPYPSNILTVDDGHSQFCGRPFNDGMKDWDAICEWMFATVK